VSDSQPTENQYIAATRRWLESVVIELNLCPFAERELRDDRVRFSVTNAATDVNYSAKTSRSKQRYSFTRRRLPISATTINFSI
jgi:hypothetical protein